MLEFLLNTMLMGCIKIPITLTRLLMIIKHYILIPSISPGKTQEDDGWVSIGVCYGLRNPNIPLLRMVVGRTVNGDL